jgi:hypothetical protein
MTTTLQFKDIITNQCASTQAGYTWYCDEHDTHGNADSEAEATWTGEAHREYFQFNKISSDGCDMYIIDVANNKTEIL